MSALSWLRREEVVVVKSQMNDYLPDQGARTTTLLQAVVTSQVPGPEEIS
jgi:hypothetical protein